jgi:hypothetical protein
VEAFDRHSQPSRKPSSYTLPNHRDISRFLHQRFFLFQRLGERAHLSFFPLLYSARAQTVTMPPKKAEQPKKKTKTVDDKVRTRNTEPSNLSDR